jgi:tetratricopeptide (TPR) repeat protein
MTKKRENRNSKGKGALQEQNPSANNESIIARLNRLLTDINPANANERLRQSLALAKHLTNKHPMEIWICILTIAFYCVDEEKKNFKVLGTLSRAAQALDNPFSKFFALSALASAHYEIGNKDKALKIFRLGFNQLKSIKTGRQKSRCLRAIAGIFKELKLAESKIWMQALNITGAIKNEGQRADALIDIISEYKAIQGNDPKVLEKMDQISSRFKNSDCSLTAFSELAVAYAKAGNKEKARESFIKAEKADKVFRKQYPKITEDLIGLRKKEAGFKN